MSGDSGWDLLVLGKLVLTMEPDSQPIENGAVAISDGKIVAVGPAEELLESSSTGEVLDASDCLIMPGFINAHSHLAMTLLRGFADDLPLKVWLEEHIWPAEAKYMTAETVRAGTALAACELLRRGVTTTTDMYFFQKDAAEVLADAGIRAVMASPLIDFPTPEAKGPEEMFAIQREFVEAFKGHPLIVPALGPHAPYTVSAANLAKEAELADELDVPLHIHLSETAWEVKKLLEEKGKSPVEYLEELGVLSDRTVAAHCVHLSERDIEILASSGVGVAHNPVSNLKLASGVAPVPRMLASGVKVALGTDGAASNNRLDLLREAQVAALLHKGVSGSPTVLPARTVLEMATRMGAEVLGLADRVGTLREGKEADLICVALSGCGNTPMYDPFSHMAYVASSQDVRHVLVAGKKVVRDGQLVTIDQDAVVAKARELAAAISGGGAR